MLRSMTGFARRETQTDHGFLAWEIKTVNHRYLETALRLPEEFRPLEPAIRERIGSRLARGKVDATLKFSADGAKSEALEVDKALLERLAAAAGEVRDGWPGDTDEPDVVDLMRWPGLLREPARDLAPLHEAGLALLEAALDELVASREREGERLAAMLETRCAAVLVEVEGVTARLPELRGAILERLRERIAALDVEGDEGRLEQEVAVLAQKADVAEELDRLVSHVSEARAAMAGDEPVGRRLDFLMQEFNREANTLASKSQDTAFTKAAVELKVLIEQMREQVQNVE